MKAFFQVENVQSAEPALALSHTFSQRGGLIGSAGDATWRIQDVNAGIAETAARIQTSDGRFTIEAVPGVEIHVNGAKSPLAQGRPIILSDKDRFSLGALECSVRIGADVATTMATSTVSTLMGQVHADDETLVIDGEYASSPPVEIMETVVDDPVEALNGHIAHHVTMDPLEAFSDQENKRLQDVQKELGEAVLHATSAPAQKQGSDHDLTGSVSASFTPARIRRDEYGFEEETTGSSSFEYEGIDQVELNVSDPVDHVALRPLVRALGLPVGPISQGEADRLLAEIGSAMRNAIEGLNRIYVRRSGQATSFPLAAMHMHAIEDNPLRFSQDVDEALHALFAKRGAVHLSAPAALQESLAHLDEHQSATEAAVNKALDAVLAALKPKALERRFANYAKDRGPAAGPERDAWCWQMYKAYFAELASQRQRGLQMLFWEVFGYEYQALMREFELERDPADGGDVG